MSPSERRDLPLPPDRTTRSGRVRRVGVELELGGLELDAAARIVAGHVGGSLGQRGRYEMEVVGDAAGPWGIELDFAWLKELGRQTRDPDAPLTPLQEAGEDVRRVIDPGYRPDQPQLVDDYLELNPTRNRALDFLPLFLHLDERRVRSVVEDRRVKARPALHYRLPNCEIDTPGWGLGQVWRDWLQVEHLAAEPDRLRAVCDDYAGYLDRFLSRLLENWREEVGAWLKPAEDL